MMGHGMMSMDQIKAPTPSEARTLSGYLEDHALREAAKAELAFGNPSDREVFQAAIAVGAVAFIVAHNHPSGDARPSHG